MGKSGDGGARAPAHFTKRRAVGYAGATLRLVRTLYLCGPHHARWCCMLSRLLLVSQQCNWVLHMYGKDSHIMFHRIMTAMTITVINKMGSSALRLAAAKRCVDLHGGHVFCKEERAALESDSAADQLRRCARGKALFALPPMLPRGLRCCSQASCFHLHLLPHGLSTGCTSLRHRDRTRSQVFLQPY